MGYTTKFQGKFEFEGDLCAEGVLSLMDLHSNDSNEQPEESPGGYCQWQLTKDRKGIEWDGGEKFYDYVEWLQYIIDHILQPNNVRLRGTVYYSGEEITDNGVLTITETKNQFVDKLEQAAVSDELAELKQFRDFVMKHDSGPDIIEDWQRKKRKANA